MQILVLSRIIVQAFILLSLLNLEASTAINDKSQKPKRLFHYVQSVHTYARMSHRPWALW